MIHRTLPLASLVLVLSACATVAPPVSNTCFHRNAHVEEEIGYCQAIRSGNTLHVSGIAAQGEMSEAVRKVYDNLQLTLKARGLTFANVVKETVFTTDLDAFIQHKGIRKEFYGKTLPSATWVQVQRLFLPSIVLEVEVTAEYPQ